MTEAPLTAIEAGLLSCETCGLLSQAANADEPGFCPRCGTELAARRHRSIERTWALVIAAAICYIPANMLPVLGTTTLGSTEYDTITVALVQLNPLMSVQPGPGVVFFAAVVVLTMIAAGSFDPRLIWDAHSEPIQYPAPLKANSPQQESNLG